MKRIFILSTMSSIIFINSYLVSDANDVLMPALFGTAIGGAAGGGRGAAIGAGVGLGTGLLMSSSKDNSYRRSRKKMQQELYDLEDRRDEIREELRFSELTRNERAELRQELKEINADIRALKYR